MGRVVRSYVAQGTVKVFGVTYHKGAHVPEFDDAPPAPKRAATRNGRLVETMIDEDTLWDILVDQRGEEWAELAEKARAYQEWTVEDLKDEIDERNECREDEETHLVKTGNRDDLIKRLVDDDKAQAEAESEEDEEVDSYDWTVAELKAEIDRRNDDGRDQDARISKTGNRDELISRLIADDEESDEEEDEESESGDGSEGQEAETEGSDGGDQGGDTKGAPKKLKVKKE